MRREDVSEAVERGGQPERTFALKVHKVSQCSWGWKRENRTLHRNQISCVLRPVLTALNQPFTVAVDKSPELSRIN